MNVKTIGILGAGKVGVVLAQLALKAGYEVYIAGSGSVEKIALTVKVLAPGAIAGTASEVAAKSDVVILALPLGKFKRISKNELASKLVIDAMNYWWEVDGPRDTIMPAEQSSSEAVQAFLSDSRVVKALGHMGYHELHDGPKAPGEVGRKALALAGNDHADLQTVSEIVNNFGFDPLIIGDLKAGGVLEPGQPGFGANMSLHKLKEVINS